MCIRDSQRRVHGDLVKIQRYLQFQGQQSEDRHIKRMEYQVKLNSEEKKKQYEILVNPTAKLSEKYMAMFSLRSTPDDESIKLLQEAFPHVGDSEMLKHEVAYCLGQVGNMDNCYEFLTGIVEDTSQAPVVRHEAAEAIGNFGDERAVPLLEKYNNKQESNIVSDTCFLSLQKILNRDKFKGRYGKKYGGTIEPAPPFERDEMCEEIKRVFGDNTSALNDTDLIPFVEKYIFSEKTNIHEKYRAMYFLRDVGSKEAILVVGKIIDPEYRQYTTPLQRHEVGFILGQLAPESGILEPTFNKVFNDLTESDIVRHEAMIALSSIKKNKEILRPFLNDEQQLVRDTVEISLDLMDYWVD
eukprot:TRINITY_DN3194_c0_g1_i17.p1 TRINITY_DN3194_c0_g1~~TRINITY_DN3194_c0_g1_i17.p1  ORF type:complete len:381 (-),score=94.07 TRINITY_DN3194_c0_g1_i17:139-1206(-)